MFSWVRILACATPASEILTKVKCNDKYAFVGEGVSPSIRVCYMFSQKV